MKPSQFVCFVCEETRERGVYVRIRHHAFRGRIVKVCKRAECRKRARAGTLWLVDPLTLEDSEE